MNNGSPNATASPAPDRNTVDGPLDVPPVVEIPLAVVTALAHELRNTLGPIRTATYLLRASTGGDAQALWALDLVDRQVQAISAATDELTDLVRLARGTLELAFDPIDLADVLDAAASICGAALAERRQSLVPTRPVYPVAVSGDRGRLIESFAALLRAASRAAPIETTISIAVERGASTAIAAIGAAGSERGSDSNGFAASVSLALARGIIERHRGEVAATGRAQFEVRLPLVDQQREAMPTAKPRLLSDD